MNVPPVHVCAQTSEEKITTVAAATAKQRKIARIARSSISALSGSHCRDRLNSTNLYCDIISVIIKAQSRNNFTIACHDICPEAGPMKPSHFPRRPDALSIQQKRIMAYRNIIIELKSLHLTATPTQRGIPFGPSLASVNGCAQVPCRNKNALNPQTCS